MKPQHWVRGGAVVAVLLGLVVTNAAGAIPAFSLKWGTSGTGDGQFNVPAGIATDVSGNVFVADRNNDRIQKFDTSGNHLLTWGGTGAGQGQFSSPRGIAVDKLGNVYVADFDNDRIQKFTGAGAFILEWGSTGAGNGQFRGPRAIAVDEAGRVYVTEDGFASKRVQKFTGTGVYLTQWGSLGNGDGQFQSPRGIAVQDTGYVYVSDTLNDRIEKFTSMGAFVMSWGQQGSGDGDLDFPIGLAWTGQSLLVVDSNNHRVQEFDSTGGFLDAVGSHCQLSNGTDCTDPDGGGPLDLGDGEFNFPLGVAVDAGGNVFVTDTQNSRVEKFGTSTRTGIGDAGSGFFGRLSAFPNPMGRSTRIILALEEAPGGDPSPRRAEVDVYDLAGRRVRSLLDGPVGGGETVLDWDGRGEAGAPVAPGIYFVKTRIEGAGSATLKVVRLP